MNDWQSTLFRIFQILEITIKSIKVLSRVRKVIPKEYIVTEIRDNLQNGELHFGDKITVVGTFSEYLPFIDPKFLLEKGRLFAKNLPRTARIEAINDVYCGALFPLYQKDAFAEETIPLFYRIDSKMLEHFTGEMLEIKCKITQVPMMYREIINQNRFFAYEKEENVSVPFGLEVMDVEPYGLVDSFKINMWLIGSLVPSPHFKYKKKGCLSCANLFGYLKVCPADWPVKYGCLSSHFDVNAPENIRKMTEEFLKLENQGVPHLVFPDLFRLFEVFCPNVDLLNGEQVDIGHNLLTGAIGQNLEELFKSGGFPDGFQMPEEAEVNIDFQYDQRQKLVSQTFDPTKVPLWRCPSYEFDPHWKEKLLHEGTSEEELRGYEREVEKRRKFKIKRRN